MSDELWSSVWLSVRVAVLATVLASLLAVPVAYMHSRTKYLGKNWVEAIIIAPMILPPTVVGYLLIIVFGARGFIGQFLYRAFDYSIAFRFEGAVIAAALVALPLLYLPARSAFASVERELEDIARTFGATRWQLFWDVSLPLAARGILSGLMLAFARALGEFGATAMVFGIRDNHTTLPLSIYLDYEQGEMNHALPAVCLLLGISMLVTVAYNRSALSQQSSH